MTARRRGMREPGSLGARLALAFVAVALAAVAVLSGLVLLAARSVPGLADAERDEAARAVAAALALAYERAGGWDGADLSAAAALAAASGAELRVLDASGRVVESGPSMPDLMARMHAGMQGPLGAPRTQAVLSAGERVGVATLRFPDAGPSSAQVHVRQALQRTVAAGAGLAALVALGVAVVVSGRITRPLRTLTRTTREMERGNRDARAGSGDAPGELGELARSFDRMADALSRQDALRRSLVADVAHELRTPVTILQGQIEEMLDGHVEPAPDQLASLHEEVLRLGRLVSDLETLSGAEAAALRLERRPVDLAEVVSGAARPLQARFESADVRLVTELDPVTVDADPARIGQVVTNLLTNALRFTPEGGTVRVGVEGGDGLARLTVEDTGRGIAPDDLPHVFERFWHGRGGGTGIGLAVVAAIVGAHDGRVEASSEPGRGSRFTVLLPRA